VEDNGIGIAAKFQDQVFGLFERLNNDIPGTGIGLALVKRIVEVHNGKIHVQSDGPGHGSSIIFTLPKSVRPVE
jgi:signal transduction histidine kinase